MILCRSSRMIPTSNTYVPNAVTRLQLQHLLTFTQFTIVFLLNLQLWNGLILTASAHFYSIHYCFSAKLTFVERINLWCLPPTMAVVHPLFIFNKCLSPYSKRPRFLGRLNLCVIHSMTHFHWLMVYYEVPTSWGWVQIVFGLLKLCS